MSKAMVDNKDAFSQKISSTNKTITYGFGAGALVSVPVAYGVKALLDRKGFGNASSFAKVSVLGGIIVLGGVNGMQNYTLYKLNQERPNSPISTRDRERKSPTTQGTWIRGVLGSYLFALGAGLVGINRSPHISRPQKIHQMKTYAFGASILAGIGAVLLTSREATLNVRDSALIKPVDSDGQEKK